MCGLKGLQWAGVALAILATVASLGVQGFYAWKFYEVTHCNTTYDASTYNPCQEDQDQAPVCIYDDLEFRSYVGLGEGIVGILVSVGFIIGFAVVNIPLLWVWVFWALGIAAYNSFCIYDYSSNIKTLLALCGEEKFWESLPSVQYGQFFITVLSSVCVHSFVLVATVPLAAAITYTYTKGNMASYEFSGYVWDNDAFQMD